MKSDTTKPSEANETQLLNLLKKVLPKATHDAKLAGKIYSAIEKELQVAARAKAFDKFCQRCQLPDLEPKTLQDIQRQFGDAFGDGDITLKPDRRSKTMAVEVALSDGSQFSGEIKVRPADEAADEEAEVTLKFVPFPVALPGDQELVWLLAKRENLAPQEAALSLAKAEDDFWASKTGQKLIRDRVERSFPEFIARVPAGLLSEAGLKRHYKTPEPVKVLRISAKR